MFWKYNTMHKLRQLEDENLMKQESEEYRKRVAMEVSHDLKKSILMIVKGIGFGILLTLVEYILKNPGITGYVRTLLWLVFFLSVAGVLYVPIGVFNLIKNLFAR